MNKNDFKYTIEKNKDKIILGVSIVGVLGLGFGFFSMVNNNKTIYFIRNKKRERKAI